jgi:hypothetical protein
MFVIIDPYSQMKLHVFIQGQILMFHCQHDDLFTAKSQRAQSESFFHLPLRRRQMKTISLRHIKHRLILPVSA